MYRYLYICRATPHSLMVSYKPRHTRTTILMNKRMIMYSNTYAFKYICIQICMYAYISIYRAIIHSLMACIQIYMHSNIYAFKYICIRIYMYTYMYITLMVSWNLERHIQQYSWIYVWPYIQIQIFQVYVHSDMYVYVYIHIYRATPHSLMVSYKPRHIRTTILTNIRMIMYSNIYAFKYICICIYTPSSLMASLRCHQGGRCSPITCIYTYTYIWLDHTYVHQYCYTCLSRFCILDRHVQKCW
jgi:hypothetical protein